MRSLLIGVSLLALAAPAARAQQADQPTAAAVSGQAEPGRYLVYFGFNKATLDANARQVVAEAADEYKRTGAAQITVTGHADKAGRAEYNQRLSERRAETVRRELERLGVPASAVQVAAEGENDPAVPTPDGVPEARNRRVVIAMPQPAPPPAPPAVAARDAPAAGRGPAGPGARARAAQALRLQPRPDLRPQLPREGPRRDPVRLRRRGAHAQRRAGPRRAGAEAGRPLRLQRGGRRAGGPLGAEPRLRARPGLRAAAPGRQRRRRLRQGRPGRVRRRPGARPRPQPDAQLHAPAAGRLRLPAPQPELGRGHPP